MKNKMKTKKALLKRVKITGTGKWLFKRAFTSHLALNKSTKQKRQLRKIAQMNSRNQAQLKRGLPYATFTKKNKNSLTEIIKPHRGRQIYVNKNIEPNNNMIGDIKGEIIDTNTPITKKPIQAKTKGKNDLKKPAITKKAKAKE